VKLRVSKRIFPPAHAPDRHLAIRQEDVGPVLPGPFDPLEALVAASAEHPRCAAPDRHLR
jgi:hypothetical protein